MVKSFKVETSEDNKHARHFLMNEKVNRQTH